MKTRAPCGQGLCLLVSPCPARRNSSRNSCGRCASWPVGKPKGVRQDYRTVAVALKTLGRRFSGDTQQLFVGRDSARALLRPPWWATPGVALAVLIRGASAGAQGEAWRTLCQRGPRSTQVPRRPQIRVCFPHASSCPQTPCRSSRWTGSGLFQLARPYRTVGLCECGQLQ